MGSARRSSLKGRERAILNQTNSGGKRKRWTIFHKRAKRAIFNQTNIGGKRKRWTIFLERTKEGHLQSDEHWWKEEAMDDLS